MAVDITASDDCVRGVCAWDNYLQAILRASLDEDVQTVAMSTTAAPRARTLPFDLPDNFTCTTELEIPELPDLPSAPLTFPCGPITSNGPATSVHALTPADIKVVGAMGDSLTAANGAGAQTIVGSLREYRGISFSIGGDDTYRRGVITLPNILKEYTSDLIGFSVGIHDREAEESYFNVGQPGDIARDMKYQAYRMIDRMKAHPAVDFENDWKLVTMFIGGNDLCYYCTNKKMYTAELYIDYIQAALDILHEFMPKTYVNLISVLKVPEIGKLNKPKCNGIHCAFCRCAKYGDDQDELMQLLRDYQNFTNVLVESGRYDTADDFTVVVQPFLEETVLPELENGEPDYSYFAQDCFHFSEKGHQEAAIALWNNMFEPVGEKSQTWYPGSSITCPNESLQYFYTYKNSPNYQFPTNPTQAAPSSAEPTTLPSAGDNDQSADCPPDDSEEMLLTAIILLQRPKLKDDSPEELTKYRQEAIDTLNKLVDGRNMVEKPVRTHQYNFTCPHLERSDPKPESVHKLRPGDFDVVAALGDSITAANGAAADNLLQVIRQARELSWSIGGDRSLQDGVLTLPNILRQYNPDLTGFSIGSSPDTNLNISRLNVAVPGARARHMLEQTEELIDRLKSWDEVDYENDWKVVTIFIGGNDLCACRDYTAAEYAGEIKKSLDLMHAEMPRTMVNLAQTVVVTEINNLNSFVCDIAHLIYCECAKERWDEDWHEVYDLAREYHRALHDLVQYGDYETRDDFTVVVQPFFEETEIQDGDFDFVSPDCFHFSEYGHQMVAMSLWNNMIEPVGEKRTKWTEGDIIECPPEDFEYIYTIQNTPDYEIPTRGPSTLPPTQGPSTRAPSTEEPTLPYTFECDIPPPTGGSPTSVHELRPSDVNVLAALGDSLTAGVGIAADNLAENGINYRGLSWSIGGDNSLEEGTLTLTNIIRKYNPDVRGFSIETGSHTNHNISRLNVAVGGARARHMLEQTEDMIDRMKTYDSIDYENDWKVVTLFIGGNDLCAYCRDPEGSSAEAYTEEIKKALDLMHAEMPKTFVNLAQVLLVTEINKLDGYCDLIHLVACRCAKERWDENWEDVLDLAHEYHRALEDLVEYGQYDTRDDFTVVIQPFYEETYIPWLEDEGKWDDSMFAPDCFHLSEYGHQASAMSLWNNMIEPVGEKRIGWVPDDVIECPSEEFEYFYTYKNTPGYVAPTRGPTTEPPSTVAPTLPTFECPIPPPSAERPTSVHELRPSDVDVMAALGDSITAGFGAGAETFAETGIQYRGISWSIGGDNSLEEGTLTLTNIIREYNPDVRGFSIDTGSHNNHNISRLNVAVGGARARHMLGQTEDMIDRMKTYDSIDYENDWKVVTLFIGGNDLCAYCRDPEGSTAEAYTEEIKKALDLMHAEMPKTFVNLVQVLLVTEINKLDGYCDFIHLAVCSCAKERWDENWEEVLDLAHEYHRSIEELVEYGQYDTREDFTVVIQPFYEETYIPWLEDEGKWDDSLFSPDCFHFSESGHQLSAMSLWNNMIEPVGEKRTGWVPEDIIECPSEEFEYFYTYKNTPGYVAPTRGPTTEPPSTVEPTLPTFDCPIPPPSAERPTSVHELRPSDVDVMAALGDSITAGFGAGAETLFQTGIQYRGISWSIGGDNSLEEGTLTLTNIIREYNPDVRGFSIETGSHNNHNISRLNVAVGGARARHMLGQTEDMIDRMKTYDSIDYENDWKVVTLFIGGNDLCAYCRDPEGSTAEAYTEEIKKALDLMHAEMPKTFVNLVQVLLVTEINKLEGYCDFIHLAVCPCAKERWDENWEEVLDLAHDYHRSIEEIVEYGQYDTRDDFTVVIQPFYEETYIPWLEDEGKWDDSLFSPDCFHFSESGHQMSAMSLWNNMIEPVGEKRTGWVPEDIIECPSEEFEYFYTYKNTPGYVAPTRGPTTEPPSTVEPTLPYTFECPIPPPSAERPTSVHELRPSDVDVMAALGDSITAGFAAGAETFAEIGIQYRGISWSIGGDNSLEEGTLTLTNIIRQYNPDVRGFSIDTGSHNNHNISRLNVAVGGARARHMLAQTEDMIDRMKTYDSIDYENDWKVVTLFIGGNDLCAYCRDPEGSTAEAYTEEIKKALDLMHAEMPKTFVNLVQVLLVTEINKLDGYCDFIHLVVCPCAKERWDENWEEVLDLAHDYHRSIEEIVEHGQYDTRDDFTVVIQPFYEETYIPWLEDEGKWDDSLFSPDCFHFSELGHQLSAMSLWNNMIEPVGQKRTGWLPEDIVECPSEDFEYFYTYVNSPGHQTTTTTTTTTTATKEPAKTTTKPKTEEPTKGITEAPTEEEGPAEPVCDDYTDVFITVICLLSVVLLVCLCGFVWLAMKISKASSKYDTSF
ncbi:phospholipase B1, membrane-associated-like [Glandiceps talaboti]